MRLYVTDEIKEDLSFDSVVMTSSEFNCIKAHPFIVSSRFDEIVIDITEKVQLGYIKQVMSVTKVIPKIIGEITSHTVSVLCELYKDRAAEMRYTFIRDKDGFIELINKMKTDYCWEQFY